MKVFVTMGGREFVVELHENRAIVREGDGEHAVSTTCRIVCPPASTALSEGAEVLVAPGNHGDAPNGALPGDPAHARAGDAPAFPGLSPVHVAFWGKGHGSTPERTLRLLVRGRPVEAAFETELDRLRAGLSAAPRTQERLLVRSPLPGVIRQIFVFPGNEVREGEPIMTLEAMKMENEIRAEANGLLEALHVEEGQVVNASDRLCEITVSHGSAG